MSDTTTHSAQIVLVEDDLELASLTQNYLTKNNFDVHTISDGANATEEILSINPDLVILDIMLPNKDGMDICKELRPNFNRPILMLTARSDNIDQILGLEIGADDYLCKPVEPRLLLAHIKALLRRIETTQETSSEITELTFQNLYINKAQHVARLDSEDIDLNPQEFKILWYLAINAGQILSRNDIFLHARGFDYDGQSRFVDIAISHIRQKIKDDNKENQRIKTIFGQGYLFNTLS